MTATYVAARKGYDHVPTSLDYSRDDRSEMDRDPEGQSRSMTRQACKQFLATLQVCWHCLTRSENRFKQSARFTGPVSEGLNPHSVGL